MIGLVAGTYKPLDPDRSYMDFVERCLKEKGYDVSGWQ
jgi:outer membrane lipoprotein SlyB